jgi:hypothetical protein
MPDATRTITDIIPPGDSNPYGSYRLNDAVVIIGEPRELPRPLGPESPLLVVDERPVHSGIKNVDMFLRRRIALVLSDGSTVYGCTMCDAWGDSPNFASRHNEQFHPQSKSLMSWSEPYVPKDITKVREPSSKLSTAAIAQFLAAWPTPSAMTVAATMRAHALLTYAAERIASLTAANTILSDELGKYQALRQAMQALAVRER